MQNTLRQLPAPPHSPTLSNANSSAFLVSAPFVPARAVVGYARVSTDLQREKETIKTQVDLIERYCVEQNLRLVEMICDDGVSGTLPLEQRPGGQRLLDLCRSGKVAALIVYKADRIGRDVWVNEIAVRELHDHLGVDFIGVAERIDLSSPIGRAMFTFQSAIGRLERENTLQRSRDATIRLAREGAYLGGIVPFGYRVQGKDRDARLRIASEVDPQTGMSEADVVRQMFEWSAKDGLSSVQIAAKLNDLGVPTSYVRDERQILKTGSDGAGKRKQKTSGLWRGGRVRNMLIEPTYKGLHTWGRRGSKRRRKDAQPTLVERVVPAIVDTQTWDGAQLTLARNRIARPDIVKRPYLLRGLMKCSSCGLTFIGTVSQGRMADKMSEAERLGLDISASGHALRPYYQCNSRSSGERRDNALGHDCPARHIRAKELEALVWEEIQGFLQHPESVVAELEILLRERLGEGGSGEGDLFKELDGLRGEAASKEAERGALYRLFRKGLLPESDLESQLNELRAEEAALAQRLEKVERAVEKARDARSLLDGARAMLLALREKVETGDCWGARRRVVENLVAGIEVETLPKASHRESSRFTLRISYRFEVPDLEDVVPAPYFGRTGHSAATVLGLSLQRIHKAVDFGHDPFAAAREVASELLEAHPDMMAKDVAAEVLARTGRSISAASVSRLRSRLAKEGEVAKSGEAIIDVEGEQVTTSA